MLQRVSMNPGGIAIHEDKHQAPTPLRIRPLSLQNAGDARVPMGMITPFGWQNSSGRVLPMQG